MSSQIQAVYSDGKHFYIVFFRGIKIGEFKSFHNASLAISEKIASEK